MATYGKAVPHAAAAGDGTARVSIALPATPAGRDRRQRIQVAARLLGRIAPVRDTRGGRGGALRVGRFVVNPRSGERRSGNVGIALTASRAFGTGWHPSTQLCLEAIERYVSRGARVLDVGAGSGILSIAAAKVGAREVVAADTSRDGVEATRRNARANRVTRRIVAVQGTVPQPGLGTFDVAVVNINARVDCALAPHVRAALTPGGVAIVAGVLEGQRSDVVACLRHAGFSAIEERRRGEWVCFAARARRGRAGGSP